MTDTVRTLTVELERPIRVDDVQILRHAIRLLSGVAEVHLGDVDWDCLAEMRARRELRVELIESLRAES